MSKKFTWNENWKFTKDAVVITDKTTGQSFKGQAFPEFMQKIIKAEGLINYINNK